MKKQAKILILFLLLSTFAFSQTVTFVGGSPKVETFELNSTTKIVTFKLQGDTNRTLDLTPVLGGGSGTDDQEISDLSLSGNTLSITLERGNTVTLDLTPILGGTGSAPIYPNELNTNPELLINFGAICMPPNEQFSTPFVHGFEPQGNAIVSAVYDSTNGVGDIVMQVDGDGVTSNPIARVFYESEFNATYNIDFRYRTLSANTGGRIAILGGADIQVVQIPNNSNEWQTISFTVTDNNNAYNGIVIAVQGYQPTSSFQFKSSQKLAQ